MSSLQNNDAARAAASSDKKSAARRAGRSNTSPDTSSACSMCARSMRVPSVSWREKIRRSRQRRKRKRRSKKALRGPGLLAYIVTSKFADYLPLYRLEDIFERQGFAISRATQSVWCGDVADVVEPLYRRMAERVRQSHVVATDDTVFPMLGPGQTQSTRMWVYVGDEANPYNVFDFTMNRGREGPKEFLKDYTEVLLADAYGGYNGVVAGNAITRAGCWAHARRKFVEAEKTAPEIAREAVDLIGRVFSAWAAHLSDWGFGSDWLQDGERRDQCDHYNVQERERPVCTTQRNR